MTAAIPPACCADHDTHPAPPDRVGRAYRGDFACAGSGADYSCLRADADTHPDANTDVNAHIDSVAEPFAVSNTDADALTFAKPLAVADSDRRQFERGVDRQSR
jgi:hypothetical protein